MANLSRKVKAAITTDLLAISNGLATQWKNVTTAISPLRQVFELSKAILENDNLTLNNSLIDLARWSFSDTGVYQHTEQVNESEFILSVSFNWGKDAPGKTAGSAIDKDIHNESNYFSNLTVSISQTQQAMTFNYDGNSGPLAPLLGVQAGVAGPQTVSITSWAEGIVNQYKTMTMNLNLGGNNNSGNKTLNSQLAFIGRPNIKVEYNISDPSTPTMSVEENPILLNLVDSETAEGKKRLTFTHSIYRYQRMDVKSFS